MAVRTNTNRNMGRFCTQLAFSEWDGFEIGGPKQAFYVKVTDRDSTCEVYVFEPSLPGETWNILVLKYNGQQMSFSLATQVDLLAKQLNADVEEMNGD